MDYEEIMQSITSGLTGVAKTDIKYLMDKSEEYKTHELSQEILRGIGRLIFEIVPKEKQAELNAAIQSDQLGISTVIEEAEFQIYRKNFDKALEILEALIAKGEDENGNRIIFIDDTVSEYHAFDNYFEEILYKELFQPTRTVRNMPENFYQLYSIYGALLVELKHFDEAKVALEKAIEINPIGVDAIFELAEISKLNSEWDQYLALTKRCLHVAYTGKHVSRCFRNFGYYYVEQKDFNLAAALYLVSGEYDKETTMSQSQLFYIQHVSGKPIPKFTHATICKLFEKEGIPTGPNNDVIGIAYSLGKLMADNGNNEGARYLFSIVYDLTESDEIKAMLDSLPK